MARRRTGRKGRKVPSGPEAQRQEDAVRTTVSFAVPVSTERPASSARGAVDPAAAPTVDLAPAPAVDPAPAPSSVLFSTYDLPEDPVSAAPEAVRQAGLMMEKTKAAYKASMTDYNASSALRTNGQVSFLQLIGLLC